MAVAAARDLILNLRENRQGHAFLEVANDLERTAKGADHTGDAFSRMRQDAQRLETEIAATKAHIKDLNVQFARTGDRGLFGDIGAAERDLKRLEKTLKAITPDLGVEVTNDFGKQLSTAFSGKGGMPGLAPAVIGGLIEAAVLAAPTIGAILAGGIAGAVGTGAMAAGILSAAKDAQVQSAAKQFGSTISAEFFGGGQAFVKPVLEGLDILEHGFADMHVGDALAKMAPTVTVIAEGIADLGRNLMPGLNKALDRMGPLADAAADGFAQTGHALGEFLDDVTSSKGTVEGLRTLFALVNGTVIVLGKSLEGLANVFHRSNAALAGTFGGLEDIFAKVGLDHLAEMAGRANDGLERLTGTGESIHGMFRRLGTEGVDPFTGYLRDAWQEMDRLRDETESTRKGLLEYFNTLRGMDDANIAWEQSLDDLTKSVQENGRSLDIHTDKGRNNIRAVEEGIQAAQRQYETGQITAKQYDEQIQKLIALGVQLGLNRQALEQLAGKYTVQIIVDLIGANIVAGAGKFIASALGNIFHSSTSVGGGTGRPAHESFASGGETPSFAPFEVHSGEMLWSNRQHYVSTAAQTRALASGGGSSTQQVVEFRVTGAADSAVAQLIHALQRKGALQIFSSAIVTR